MSEYQYYEFQAIDRPLGDADRRALRELSTRARITTTSFTNSYDWGDFQGDPARLMERWFDLHLYLANWGTRRLMIRFPKRLVDRSSLDGFLHATDCAELMPSGENLIADIMREELEPEYERDDDGSGWLAALAPLRADVLGGDLRLFYLLWLTSIEAGAVREDEMEPLSGIGPMTGALDAFARFFQVDADLVAAAAERPWGGYEMIADASVVRRFAAALPDGEKTALLVRLIEGDPHVANESRALLRSRLASEISTIRPAARTVGELRARASALRHAREAEENKRLEAERRRQAEEEARARRARLDAIIRRGDHVWREVEAEIERCNAPGYDKAAGLLVDLKAIAEEQGATRDFIHRLHAIRERHARKGRFIERLRPLG